MKQILILLIAALYFAACKKDTASTPITTDCKGVYLIRETRTAIFAVVRIDTLQKDCKVCGADLATIDLRRDTGYLPTCIIIQYAKLGTPCR